MGQRVADQQRGASNPCSRHRFLRAARWMKTSSQVPFCCSGKSTTGKLFACHGRNLRPPELLHPTAAERGGPRLAALSLAHQEAQRVSLGGWPTFSASPPVGDQDRSGDRRPLRGQVEGPRHGACVATSRRHALRYGVTGPPKAHPRGHGSFTASSTSNEEKGSSGPSSLRLSADPPRAACEGPQIPCHAGFVGGDLFLLFFYFFFHREWRPTFFRGSPTDGDRGPWAFALAAQRGTSTPRFVYTFLLGGRLWQVKSREVAREVDCG